MKDLIIIGAGPIGLYSGVLAKLHSLDFLIIESQQEVGGQLIALYPEKNIIDLPGFKGITAKEFINQLLNQLDDSSFAHLKLGESVLGFEKKDNHYLINTSKGFFEAKTILICSGMGLFSPRKIGLANEDDFSNILYSLPSKNLLSQKRVVILGGGDSAVDWALALNEITKECSIVHRRNEFRAHDNQVQQMKQSSINIFTPFVVSSLNGNDGTLKSLVIENVENHELETLECDYLFVNYGMIPSKDNFPVKKRNGLIVTNAFFETSMPNIYAIGNIVDYVGKVKNITCGLGEAVIAITKIDQVLNPTKNIPIHF